MLVVPFAVALSLAALASVVFSLNILLWPVVNPPAFDEPPSFFVIIVLAASTALPGVLFAVIARILWLFILGKSPSSKASEKRT